MAKQKFNFQLNSAVPDISSEAKEPDSQALSEPKSVSSIVQRLESNDKSPFDIKLIPRNRIRMNKKNSYPIEEIDSLARSILEFGLQQNLVVIYSSEEDIYIIETGHRRATALNMLIDKYSSVTDKDSSEYQMYMKNVFPYEKGFPCKVIYLEDGIKYDFEQETDLSTVPESVIDSEIRLYITNEEIRSKNPARTAQAVARLKQLYDAKNAALNHSDKINVNKKIADNLNISQRQVAKYNAVDNLIPELRELFDSNNITLTNADSYSKLEPSEQMQIYEIIKNHDALNTRQINELIQNNQALNLQIKEQQAKIHELSKSSSVDDDELQHLKKQVALLKKEQKTVMNENSELKNGMLAARSLKLAYDALITSAQRFIRETESDAANNISCDEASLKNLISITKELASMNNLL